MQCPDCGAYYTEEDEFCGECGRRLSSETSGDTETAATWTPKPDSLEDLASDLFEPPPPEPTRVEITPRRTNLLPIAIAAGLALLVLLLCAGGALAWLLLREESAAVPPGMLLYEEDFNDPDGAWSTFDGDGTAVSYEDGGYRMTINRANYMVWGDPEPALDLSDLVIEVDVRQVEGPLDNNFGVFVRYLEGDDQYSYYWFQISGDGFYSVDLRKDGEWITLEGWEESRAINTGLGVTNHIRVDCSGGQFSFYTNEVHLIDVFDSTIDRGSIGLAAGTFEEPGVVVEFDDLRVYEPGE